MSGTVFDHIPAPIVATILGVILTALVGLMIRLFSVVSTISTRLAMLEAERESTTTYRRAERERITDLWERVEKHIDGMEVRLEAQIKEVAIDVKSLVKDMHQEFMGCPNHRPNHS